MSETDSFLEQRRETLLQMPNPPVNGVNFVDILPAAKQIDVIFVHRRPGHAQGRPSGAAAITADMITISGGDRFRDIKISHIEDGPTAWSISVFVEELGDFSTYTLTIDHPGLDEMLREIRFQFHPHCLTEFDCNGETGLAADPFPIADINHLAKDFDSFRQAMLDRMAVAMPDWQDRQTPDLGIALVELMAHYADHLSYAQDAAGTEAYLSTARRRASLRRHAKLVGYDVQDGLSARVFVQVEMSGSGEFNRGDFQFLTALSDQKAPVLNQSQLKIDGLLADGVQVFEPVDMQEPLGSGSEPDAWAPRSIKLQESANQLTLHDWGDERAVLPKGSQSAWIVKPDLALDLGPGDFLLLELTRDPDTKRRADADPAKRQVVCLNAIPEEATDHLSDDGALPLLRLSWAEADALRFDLPIGRLDAVADGGDPHMARAAGNIVLADHGVTLPQAEEIGSPLADDDPEAQETIDTLSQLDRPRRFRPRLSRRDISVAGPLRVVPGQSSVTEILADQANTATKVITLEDGSNSWTAVSSLLFAREDDRVFVPETEADGTTLLRFGRHDGGGARPLAGQMLTAHYRVGVGRAGNIGAGAIAHVALSGVSGPLAARNPLPGFGGRDRESVEEIKINALSGIQQNRRAVTRADYQSFAEDHPGVDRAFVRTLGHGSWTVFVVAVDPLGRIEATPEFLADVRAHLEPYRLMGQDLLVEAPKFAPIALSLRVCVCKDHSELDVRREVLRALSSNQLDDGRLGLFHPDNLSFGDPVYTSRIIAAVKSMPGVADVTIDSFGRWRSSDPVSLENGVLQVSSDEIPILMNDPNFPERGVLTVETW